MALEITSVLLERLLSEAHEAPGHEICGLLFGTAERIEAAQACTNVAEDPTRQFEIDPAALFAAHCAAREGRAQVIGHYHSHPSGLPEPSLHDADAAMADGAIWLILSGADARFFQAGPSGEFHDRFQAVACRLVHDTVS